MHYHDEIRIISRLMTNAIIRNDKGRARRQQLRDLLKRVVRKFNAIESIVGFIR